MLNRENYQGKNDLDKAGQLRREADFLEKRQQVRARLGQLQQLSIDPYYDRYLAQMVEDLESGRATPAQVGREAERSYRLYLQRIAHKTPEQGKLPLQGTAPPLQKTIGEISRNKPGGKHSMEFKIGAHVFSVTGAIFVLAAFVIFGVHFLGGMVQGMCLFGTAALLFLFSECWLKRRAPALADIVTGIAICGAYAANFINFQVLHTINPVVTMVITFLIASLAVWAGKRADSMVLRLVGLIGCYISVYPVGGFGTGLDFLALSLLLFLVGSINVLFPARKRPALFSSLQLLLHVVFTAIYISIAWGERVEAVYLTLFAVVSFVFISFLGVKNCREERTVLFPFCCIGSGILLFLIFLIGNLGPGIARMGIMQAGQRALGRTPDMALFVHLAAETLVAAICGVGFLLWDKEDGRKWAQLYYGVILVLLFAIFSENQWESLISFLAVLLAVKFASGHKEVLVLDCMVVTATGMVGIWQTYAWDSRPFVGALFAGMLFLSSFRIRQMHLFHETVATVCLLLMGGIWCGTYLPGRITGGAGWICPFSVALLLVLFLMFNCLPGLKGKNQLPYNIVNIFFMAMYHLCLWLCNSSLVSWAMLALGTVAILVMYRERFGLAFSGKYLLLAGFLVYCAVAGHFGQPVAVSILLMLVSLGCVAMGFKIQNRMQRACGLAMAAFVCLKLVLYDSREMDTANRGIVFLATGMIALVISFLYIRLERRREAHGAYKEQIRQESQAESENRIGQTE